MTMVMINLSIHFRLWFIENRNEIYFKMFRFKKIVKYKFLRSVINLGQSLQSNEIADSDTLGYLLFSILNKYLRKIINDFIKEINEINFVSRKKRLTFVRS
jgi:hypothetical protein